MAVKLLAWSVLFAFLAYYWARVPRYNDALPSFHSLRQSDPPLYAALQVGGYLMIQECGLAGVIPKLPYLYDRIMVLLNDRDTVI